MDSPLQTEFPISFGGKDFTLSYPIPSVWAYEELAGVDLTSGTDKRTPEERLAEHSAKTFKDRMKDVGDLLWAGLIANQPEVKREDVEALVMALNFRQFGELNKRVAEAFAASLPQATEEASPLAETPNPSS